VTTSPWWNSLDKELLRMQFIFNMTISSNIRGIDMATRITFDQTNDMDRLSYGELLLVWSWQKIVRGDGGCPLITREFSRLCGDDAGEVLATFYAFLRALSYAGRRHQQVGHPGCAVLTHDEQQMLFLIAVAQRSDAIGLEFHLKVIATAGRRPVLDIAVRALGAALNQHNLLLPLPVPSLALDRCG
jgi:hypothetical protein